MTSRRRAATLSMAAVLVLLLALGLRLHHVGDQSLWYDEGTSAGLATRGATTIVRNAANDIHPPLYYLALAGWSRIAGHSEAGLRGLSVFAGVVLVALVLGLGRRLWGWGEGLAAGLLAATSPFLVWYSQEARMYSMAAALGAALAWVAAELAGAPGDDDPVVGPESPKSASSRSDRVPRRRAAMWLAYLALAVGALYTHYFVGASAVAAANLIAVAGVARARRRRGALPTAFVRRWVGAQLVALALFLPWLAAAWHTISDWPALGPRLASGELARKALHTFVLGIHDLPALGWWALLGAALVLVGVVGGLRGERRWGTAVAGCMVLAPLAAMWVMSLTRPAWDPKFLIAAAPGFELLMGAGVVVLGRWASAAACRLATSHAGWVGRASYIAAVASATVLWLAVWPRVQALQAAHEDPALRRDDYRGIVTSIAARAGPRDAVIVNAPTQIEIFEYYDRGRHATYPIPLGRQPDFEAVIGRLEMIATDHRDLYAVLWATEESDPDGVVEGWLNENRAKAYDSWFGNVRLAMWAAPREPMRDVLFDLLTFGDDEIYLARLTVGPAAVGGSGGDAGARQHLEGPAAAETTFMRLAGEPVSVLPGGIVAVDAWWARGGQSPAAGDYTVFLHLVDDSGRAVAQRDMAPVGGTSRTSEWQSVDGFGTDSHDGTVEVVAEKGDVVRDRMALIVPRDLAPGEYELLLGLYEPATGERLSVRPFIRAPGVEYAPADHVEVAVVTVEASD